MRLDLVLEKGDNYPVRFDESKLGKCSMNEHPYVYILLERYSPVGVGVLPHGSNAG